MQKKYLKKLFLLSLLAGIFYACKDVYEVEVPSETSSFSIAEARNWFEANAPSIKSGGIFLRSGDEPDEEPAPVPILNWNLAEMSSNPKWEVVELPWKYEEIEEIFALGEVWEHALANNKTPESVIRLVVVRYRETGETHGFRMKVAPTLDYLLRSGENLHTNMYLCRDSELSGIVMFYTLRGQFLNGWRYVDGKVVSEIIGVEPRGWYGGGNHLCFLYGDVVIAGQRPPPRGPLFPEFVPDRLGLQEKETELNDCAEGNCGGGYGGGANMLAITVDIRGSAAATMGDFARFEAVPQNFNASNMHSASFYIRRKLGGSFNRVYSGAGLDFSMLMRNPGKWEVKVVVLLYNARVLVSPTHRVEVQFPYAVVALANPAIRNAMTDAWRQTRNSASADGRREYGFWIYADTRGSGLAFVRGQVDAGAFVPGCVGTHASIMVGGRNEIPANPHDARSGGRFAIAHFHTHTPLTFCPRYIDTPTTRYVIHRTPVGPSQSDRDWANGWGMPGLVYDYVGEFIYGAVRLVGGHNINAPAQVWTFGPHRRATPD